MTQINLTKEQARDFYRFAVAIIGGKPNPVLKYICDTIENDLRPRSTNQADYAVWKSEHILPNLVEAWKRKNVTAEETFGHTQALFREATPAEELKGKALQYSVVTGGDLYNELVNGRSGRW